MTNLPLNAAAIKTPPSANALGIVDTGNDFTLTSVLRHDTY